MHRPASGTLIKARVRRHSVARSKPGAANAPAPVFAEAGLVLGAALAFAAAVCAVLKLLDIALPAAGLN